MEPKRKFKPGDMVKLINGDNKIMKVVRYDTDYLTMGLEAVESALEQVPLKELVKCEWKTENGEKKDDGFQEEDLVKM